MEKERRQREDEELKKEQERQEVERQKKIDQEWQRKEQLELEVQYLTCMQFAQFAHFSNSLLRC